MSPAHQLRLGAMANFFFLVVLIPSACLREQSSFWRNAGGWPMWLREFVGLSFFPLLVLEFLLLVAFSAACVRFLAKRCTAGSSAVVVLPVLWALFLLVITILAANNLENLMTGRSLHWHAD
jgi:hypothetical protein